MHPNTTIAIGIASIFLGLGIAAAGGADENTVFTIAFLGFWVALGLVVRLEAPERPKQADAETAQTKTAGAPQPEAIGR